MTTRAHTPAASPASTLRPLALSLLACTLAVLSPGAIADDAPARDKPDSRKSDPTPADKSPDAAPRDHVVMTTSMGQIVLRLNVEKAPISVENFIKYADDRAYDGTIFHRVISNFMIQGGGFNPDMTQRPTRAPIRNEATNGLSNKRGTIAMARTAAPDTATSQFYINVQDNPNLDHNAERRSPGYAVFGEVIAGLEVVDRIREVRTGSHGAHRDVPVEPVVIERVVVVDAKTAHAKIEAKDKDKDKDKAKDKDGTKKPADGDKKPEGEPKREQS